MTVQQFNIADTGYGMRGPRVYNDRAGEVGRGIDSGDYDLRHIFEDEGVEIVHMFGLFAAMSPQTGKTCLKLAECAKSNGAKVSFDMNYRASFWKGREAELHEIFSAIASRADILIGNEEDFQLALGIQGPEAGGEGLSAKIDSFKEMIMRVATAANACPPTCSRPRGTISEPIPMSVWTGREGSSSTPIGRGRAAIPLRGPITTDRQHV